jgi:hypothetical protein
MRFVEWLATSVGSDVSKVFSGTRSRFFAVHNSPDSYGVLELLRTQPKVIGMLISLGHEDRAKAYPMIDVPSVDSDPGVAMSIRN